MAVITAEVLNACGVQPEDKEPRAAEALERKYHTEFVITEVYPQKFGELYYQVQAFPADEPSIIFRANIDTEDDEISDNYVERLVCAQISAQVEKNLDGLPGYYATFTHGAGPQSIVTDPTISIREYAALDGGNRFRVELYVVCEEETTADGLYDSISRAFHDLEFLQADIRLVFTTQEQLEKIDAYFERNDGLYTEYQELTEKLLMVDVPFTGGEIGMGRQAFAEKVKGAL